MSCHGCATKFGVFTKENGCPNCGFAFCNKCLRFKAIVPKLGMAERSVCKSCYENLSSEKKDIEKEYRPPPDAFLRRLESLENPARPPITVYHHNPRMEELKTGLTAEDREIAERLEKLKEERKRHHEVPTEEDLVRRLAALKGEHPEKAVEATKKREVFKLPDTRSDEEKTNDLIKQLIQEQILAAKHISPEDLIAKRLARLREEPAPVPSASNEINEVDVEAIAGNPAESEAPTDVRLLMAMAKTELDALQQEQKPGMTKSKTKQDLCDESSDSDDGAVEQIVQRAIEEAALGVGDEDELEREESPGVEDPEELPWCAVCNEDAVVRCLGCDGDLFCSKCAAEFHAGAPAQPPHRFVAFPAPKRQ